MRESAIGRVLILPDISGFPKQSVCTSKIVGGIDIHQAKNNFEKNFGKSAHIPPPRIVIHCISISKVVYAKVYACIHPLYYWLSMH